MTITLGIIASGAVAGYVKMASPSGRSWINRMFYRGRHSIGTMRADRKWHGEPASRVVYTNLDDQRLPYTNFAAAQWN